MSLVSVYETCISDHTSVQVVGEASQEETGSLESRTNRLSKGYEYTSIGNRSVPIVDRIGSCNMEAV